ncbi:MAG: hypothetical protein L0Y44_06920 [Phycisphaerales bacterium]|nr:hypothetical protein [Phycisphaerales bacterium]MCI0630372.1 hypothetical protein [Phycisphaerales bacterium]MCI0676642.1 hypothetical protein [Phycisphaerales bacterium]
MVTNSELKHLNLSEAAQLRQQAVALLDRLTADREQSERRSADSGKRDPMKSITGQTALDTAIASTRDIIATMDSLLTALEEDVGELGAFANRRPRQILRNHVRSRSVAASSLPAPVAATP